MVDSQVVDRIRYSFFAFALGSRVVLVEKGYMAGDFEAS